VANRPGAAPRRSRGRPHVERAPLIEGEILQVALEQFVRHGYSVSMTRIIKAAGISKTTMYSRFSSKEQLFRAIIRKQIDGVAETMPLGPPKAYYDLERGLKNFANRALEVSLEGDFLEVNRLIYSEARRFPELAAAAAERNQLGIDQLSKFIRFRAEMDGVPCKDPNAIAEVFILVMRGWYMNAMLTDGNVPAKARQDWVDRSIQALISSRAEW
jgi:AcrR family transcriptional regulator